MDERINLTGAFFKRPDRTLDQCQRHYVENHGPLIGATKDFSRDLLSYTQHRRIDMSGFAPPPGLGAMRLSPLSILKSRLGRGSGVAP